MPFQHLVRRRDPLTAANASEERAKARIGGDRLQRLEGARMVEREVFSDEEGEARLG